MGTWAHGNFDNDTALDWLDDITGQLLDEIAETMESPELLEADEPDADLVPCRIELLCAMAEKGMSPQWPDVQLLAQWKQIFLEAWDSSIDELEPSEEYKRERRATLAATFDRMLALAHLAEDEGEAEED
ncbi:MAG: DUF4259 domain-containing protein [Comamonas sp.]|jgi:hypothetical protein|uniref:DUF4259 domain-containing protein n=1 Tax=Comamonas sp. TaxID=34028 RepID=UPI002831D358|nr:DUF4259 domain-containing protein [Comamonas sp.]MDR0212376.1 DUF4259 domain-containing protein [Comamonas sp.]